jgi:hypothetical protein
MAFELLPAIADPREPGKTLTPTARIIGLVFGLTGGFAELTVGYFESTDSAAALGEPVLVRRFRTGEGCLGSLAGLLLADPVLLGYFAGLDRSMHAILSATPDFAGSVVTDLPIPWLQA